MTLWTLLLSTAVAGRFAGLTEGDVQVVAETSLPPEQVIAAFADVERATRLLPDDCATKRVGRDLVWTPSWLRRKLTVVPEVSSTGRRVSWDVQGKQGFWLVVDVAPRDGGATVTLHTPLDPPGWPLRPLFFQDIRPAWAACYVDALRVLDPAVRVLEATGPVPR